MFDYYNFASLFDTMRHELNVFDVATAEKDLCELTSRHQNTDHMAS